MARHVVDSKQCILKGGFRCPEHFRLRPCMRTRPATHVHKMTKREVPRNPRNPPGSATAKYRIYIHHPKDNCIYIYIQYRFIPAPSTMLPPIISSPCVTACDQRPYLQTALERSVNNCLQNDNMSHPVVQSIRDVHIYLVKALSPTLHSSGM